MFYYVALGVVEIADISALLFLTAVISPALIMMSVAAMREVQSSKAYLESATQQEKNAESNIEGQY